MMIKKSGKYFLLPLKGFTIIEVIWDGLITLCFDDPKGSKLDIHGEFILSPNDQVERYSPKDEWVRDILESVIDVEINVVKANKYGNLTIIFEDARELFMEDGPYENWHYSNNDKAYLHGGIGRTV